MVDPPANPLSARGSATGGPSTRRVLGIDPGLTRCGYGIVEGDRARRPHLVAVGVVRTATTDETAQRLLTLERALEALVRDHRPDVVAVERVFAQHNAMTVIGTAQAAGVAMLVGARHGLPVHLHTPSEVKASVTGSGTADKAQVGTMVTRILGLASMPKPADAADAAALAICQLWRGAGSVPEPGAATRAGAGDATPTGGASSTPNRWQQAIDAHAATRTTRTWKDLTR